MHTRHLIRTTWTLLAAALVLSGIAASPSVAEDLDRLPDFQLSGRYVLHLSQKLAPTAKIYFSKPTGAYLVEAAELPTWVLIYPETGCAESISAEERVVREDGGVDLLVGELTCMYGRFRLERADIVFSVSSTVTARLKPKPPILGRATAAMLKDHTPEYVRDGKAYEPDDEILKRLAASRMSVRVIIYFGSWCSTCARLIPRILRVEEELAKLDSRITFIYYGLPPVPEFQRHAEVKRMRISKIPAGFLYAGDVGIGRIDSTQWNKPEAALGRFIR
jgi:thiol-disulfide isomerase/thioredoxin